MLPCRGSTQKPITGANSIVYLHFPPRSANVKFDFVIEETAPKTKCDTQFTGSAPSPSPPLFSETQLGLHFCSLFKRPHRFCNHLKGYHIELCQWPPANSLTLKGNIDLPVNQLSTETIFSAQTCVSKSDS